MCELLGQPPEEEITLDNGKPFIQKNWLYYEHDVRQWFILEAFRKVREEFWNEDKILKALEKKDGEIS